MRIKLERGWQVLQDHYDLGEQYALYEDQYDPTVISAGYPGGAPFQLDEWRSLPALAHLQILLSEDPHFAPEMRLYNSAPWWYRIKLRLDAGQAVRKARIHFEGVDYFCKVYFNGRYLGEHEGYQTPFAFDAPIREGENVLYVKVWSPLDFARAGGAGDPRYLMVVRRMMKGTYEHGDSLLQRDRNPVGIWRPVTLELYDNICLKGAMRVESVLDGGVTVRARVLAHSRETYAARLAVYDHQTGAMAAQAEQSLKVEAGEQEIVLRCAVDSPRLWSTWDREGPYLYEARLRLGEVEAKARFGFRKAEIERTKERTQYFLNGRRLYIRGASYFPDPYLSLMHRGRLQRDLALMARGGCNLVRVHVHQQIPQFYDLCDEMGIAVMQDTDFNWVHPDDEEWCRRALAILRQQIAQLYNHPSILTWVLLNEPVEPGEPEMGRYARTNRFVYRRPGPQMLALARQLDSQRAFILASYCADDPNSGDSHNYAGSIDDTLPYTVRQGMAAEKLNTEFGFDAPPDLRSLLRAPRVLKRLHKTEEEIAAIDYYQYRFVKYAIERYRLAKYHPTAGHIQFMLVDCSPVSYYGVVDYWGSTKPAYEAFLQSNQPIGVFFSPDGLSGGEIWVVNDLMKSYAGAQLCWTIEDADGVVDTGRRGLDVAADSRVAAAAPAFTPDRNKVYQMTLCLLDAAGSILAQNRYDDLFGHPDHPAGHPYRFSHTLGLRLYEARD